MQQFHLWVGGGKGGLNMNIRMASSLDYCKTKFYLPISSTGDSLQGEGRDLYVVVFLEESETRMMLLAQEC